MVGVRSTIYVQLKQLHYITLTSLVPYGTVVMTSDFKVKSCFTLHWNHMSHMSHPSTRNTFNVHNHVAIIRTTNQLQCIY